MDHPYQLTTARLPFGILADAAPFCLGAVRNLTQCPMLGWWGGAARDVVGQGGTVRPSPSAPAKRAIGDGYSGRDRGSGIACGDSGAAASQWQQAGRWGGRGGRSANGCGAGLLPTERWRRMLPRQASAWWACGTCQIARPSPFRVRIAADWRGGLGRVTSGLSATTRAQLSPANRDRSRTANLAPLRSCLRGDSSPTTLPSEQPLSSTWRPCPRPWPQASVPVPQTLEGTLYSHRDTPSIPRRSSSPSPLALDARPS
ncbi:hypothetical protein B0T14DRAFT_235095 [Immersiella caudata]|uniref:Uncharacterized protein n=1 Tax=Immersiella caudata TaxID=314043 RepID=A0AA40C0B1_9PEZI|nr:hypothetical protein B0T14DRAFT_235095 [Immersiella caudata]